MKYINLLLPFLLTGYAINLSYAQPKAYLDSLERELTKVKTPFQQAYILNRLAAASMFIDIDKGITYGRRALQVIPKEKQSETASIYNTVGNLYAQKGLVKEACAYMDSAIHIQEKIGHEKGLALTHGNLATLYTKIDAHEKALYHVHESLKINEKTENKDEIAHNLTTLLCINLAQNDLAEGLRNGKKALLYYNPHDFSNLGIAYFNLASVYSNLSDLDSALYYNKLALKSYARANNLEYAAIAYQEISEIFLKQNKSELATVYLDSALALEDHFLSPETKIRIQNSKAHLYYKNKDYVKSIRQYELNIKFSHDYGLKKFEKDALEGLSKCYFALGNYQKAYDYLEKGFALRDSILDEAKQRQLKELEVQYDTYKSAQDNILLAKERDIQALKARRNELFTYSAVLVLLLVLLLSYLLLRQYRARTMQQTLQLNHRLLRNQMNPHFIFNSLAAIQSFVYKSEPREAGKYLSSFARLVRAILENSREDYISLDKEIQWLENYLKLQLLRFDNKFDYQIEVDAALDVDSVQIPPMLTQPFIENALEHGLKHIDYQGLLQVGFLLKGDFLEIRVQDNGVGLTGADDKSQTKDHVSMATTITKERLSFLNQYKKRKINFEIKNIAPKGVLVSFSIPLTKIG